MKLLSPGDRSHERQNAFLRVVDANLLIEIVRGHFRSDVRLRSLAKHKHPPEDLFVPPLEPAADLAAMLLDAQARRTQARHDGPSRDPQGEGSDVNLASHLLYDVLKGACDKAIMIMNDSDLCEPVRLA